MAVLYRAIWSDVDTRLVGRVYSAFRAWVGQKVDGQLDVDRGVSAQTDNSSLRVQVIYEESDDSDALVREALYASLVETKDDGSRWTTTVRSWSGLQTSEETGTHGGWQWVDIEAVTREPLDSVTVEAPRFVRELLEQGKNPGRNGTPLSEQAFFYADEDGAEELAALITDLNRDVPVVVFAPMPANFQLRNPNQQQSPSDMFDASIERATAMTAGLAMICSLNFPAAQHFSTILGEDYGVRDGAFRIYLPGLDPAGNDAWCHRYTVLERYINRRDVAGKLIIRAISARAATRRAPASYETAARLLDRYINREPAELRELLGIADKEMNENRSKLTSLNQRYQNLIEEQQLLEEENNRLRSDLVVARKKLVVAEPRLPDRAETPRQAASMAQEYLSDYLSFPREACVDLADIDSASEARGWGNTAWRAFRALHAYGESLRDESDSGSFWTWCMNSGHPYAWTANQKKLSMRESESVNNNGKLSSKRVFPVSKELDPSGFIYMEAHVKIAEGGGQLAPRIYFLPSRKTGKVHIGYFGPHRNVPNTLS